MYKRKKPDSSAISNEEIKLFQNAIFRVGNKTEEMPKCVVIGEKNGGKTSLLKALLHTHVGSIRDGTATPFQIKITVIAENDANKFHLNVPSLIKKRRNNSCSATCKFCSGFELKSNDPGEIESAINDCREHMECPSRSIVAKMVIHDPEAFPMQLFDTPGHEQGSNEKHDMLMGFSDESVIRPMIMIVMNPWEKKGQITGICSANATYEIARNKGLKIVIVLTHMDKFKEKRYRDILSNECVVLRDRITRDYGLHITFALVTCNDKNDELDAFATENPELGANNSYLYGIDSLREHIQMHAFSGVDASVLANVEKMITQQIAESEVKLKIMSQKHNIIHEMRFFAILGDQNEKTTATGKLQNSLAKYLITTANVQYEKLDLSDKEVDKETTSKFSSLVSLVMPKTAREQKLWDNYRKLVVTFITAWLENSPEIVKLLIDALGSFVMECWEPYKKYAKFYAELERMLFGYINQMRDLVETEIRSRISPYLHAPDLGAHCTDPRDIELWNGYQISQADPKLLGTLAYMIRIFLSTISIEIWLFKLVSGFAAFLQDEVMKRDSHVIYEGSEKDIQAERIVKDNLEKELAAFYAVRESIDVESPKTRSNKPQSWYKFWV